LHVLLLHHHHSLLLLHLIHLHHILLIRHAHLLLKHWINTRLEATTAWLLVTSHWIHAHLNLSTVTLLCQQQIILFLRWSLLSQCITTDVKQPAKLVHWLLFLNWFLYFLTWCGHWLNHLRLIGLHVHSTKQITLRVLLLWISLTHQTKWILNRSLLLRYEVLLLSLLWSCLVHEAEGVLRRGSLSWCTASHAHAAEHVVHILHLLLLLLGLLLLIIHKAESVLRWLWLRLPRWTE